MKALTALFALVLALPAAAEPLIYDNGRIFVQAAIKGVATEALLDSGAESAVIDPILARRAGLPPGAKAEVQGAGGEAEVEVRVVLGVTISAGGITVKDQMVAITNLAEVSSRLIKRPTQLILGTSILEHFVVTTDFPGRAVYVAPRQSE